MRPIRDTDAHHDETAPPGASPDPSDRRIASAFLDALAYARERDYTGWDLYDGESSRILRALPVDNRWLNLAFQQVVRRAPINLRPLLLVEQRRSFLGASLFSLADFAAADLFEVGASGFQGRAGRGDTGPTGARGYRAEGRALAEWLIDNRSVGYSGFCGGHKHPLQGLRSRAMPNTPGVVGTAYAVRALLAAEARTACDVSSGSDADFGSGSDADFDNDVDVTSRNDPDIASGSDPDVASGNDPDVACRNDSDADSSDDPDVDFGAAALSAADFVLEDLSYTEHLVGAHVTYTPADRGDSRTLNANALAAKLLLDLHAASGDPRLRRRGEAILDYVVSRQTEAGGWMYRDPPSASHLSMDSFHNGFIVESLLRHHEVTGSDRYAAAIDDGLSFYWTLFEGDGAPRRDESSAYPRDVHDAAQGIIVFSRVGEHALARRIAGWTLEHLYAGDGRFCHQKRRLYTDRTTLMRWCQAWMAYALGVFLRTRHDAVEESLGIL